MHRLVIVLLWVTALTAAGFVAALVGVLATPDRDSGAVDEAVTRPSVQRPELPIAGWRVIRSLPAHAVLVVEVQTDQLEQATAIAAQIVEPVKEDYAEIMIYFYRTGRRRDLADRRVQWTPRRGYIEVRYDEDARS